MGSGHKFLFVVDFFVSLTAESIVAVTTRSSLTKE